MPPQQISTMCIFLELYCAFIKYHISHLNIDKDYIQNVQHFYKVPYLTFIFWHVCVVDFILPLWCIGQTRSPLVITGRISPDPFISRQGNKYIFICDIRLVFHHRLHEYDNKNIKGAGISQWNMMTSSNQTFSVLLDLCAGYSPVTSECRALMFSLICAWTNSSANNWDAGDLRCHHAHNDITIMWHWNTWGWLYSNYKSGICWGNWFEPIYANNHAYFNKTPLIFVTYNIISYPYVQYVLFS